ncbi:hypothetical protein Ndes2437B_g06943 [Nannochloris sp. 'desiccata']
MLLNREVTPASTTYPRQVYFHSIAYYLSFRMIAPSASKASKAHPSFAGMIREATNELKGSSKGSSRIAIKKYIKANYVGLPESGIFNHHFRNALSKLVESGVLLNTGVYFKISKKANSPALKKSETTKPAKTTAVVGTKKAPKAAPSSAKKKGTPKEKTTTTTAKITSIKTAKAKKAPSSPKKKATPKKKAVAALKKTKKTAPSAATKNNKAVPKVKKVIEAATPPVAAAAAPASPVVSPTSPTASPSPVPFQATAPVEATQMA